MLESLEGRMLLGGDPFPDLGLLEHPDNPVVRMQTDRGPIFIELLQHEVPETVKRFLWRIHEFTNNQSFFHHLEPGVRLDGATWVMSDEVSAQTLVPNGRRITEYPEVFRANTARTIAAKSIFTGNANQPSVESLVFNLADNTAVHPSNDFKVFARVLDDASWAIIEDIATLPVRSFTGAANIAAFDGALLTDVPVDEAYTSGDPVSSDIVVRSSDFALIRQSGAPDYYRHTVYSAEGFTGATINEFVPMVNPNNVDVHYEIRVRYEQGDGFYGYLRDDLVTRGVIAANSRGGVTISTRNNWGAAEVIAGRGYAIEVVSTLPIGANFSHYDYGIATGESFVGTLDTTWFIGDVEKAEGIHDFLLWYNASPESATVTLTFTPDSGVPLAPITFSTEAFRRGGVNIGQHADIPAGLYSVTIQSTTPLIASVSHYEDDELFEDREGWGAVGQSGAPSTVGIVPIAYERGGEIRADGDDVGFVFFNPGATSAEVSIEFYEPGSTTPLLTNSAVATVAPGGRQRLLINSDNLPDVPTLIAVIRSTEAVFSSQWYKRIEDSYAAGVAVTAGTTFHFAEGFIDPSRTGANALQESLTIFNPMGTAFGVADQAAALTITFRFIDGTSISIERSVGGGTGLNLQLSLLPELIEEANEREHYFYSMEVSSDVPIIAQFMHTDAMLGLSIGAGGGFSSYGTTTGSLTRIEDLGDV